MVMENAATELWVPTEGDMVQGGQGYFQYATGIAIINNPRELRDLHGRNVEEPDQAREIVAHAKTLIWDGLGDVIRFSNPPDLRSPIIQTETHFETALPNIKKIVETTAEEDYDRFNYLNPLIPNLKPLPLRSEMVYKYIAHSRRGKLYLKKAMDVFPVHDSLSEIYGDSTFDDDPDTTGESSA